MVTKSNLETNNKVIGTIVRIELAETHKRIAAVAVTMETGFQKAAKHIERVEQKLVHIVENHEERITQLEEAADLTHRN